LSGNNFELSKNQEFIVIASGTQKLNKIGLNYVKDNEELNLLQESSTWIKKKIHTDEAYEL